MKDYEKLSREHFDGMADNYAATDGLYYTELPKLSCDEIMRRCEGIKIGSLLDVGCGSGYLLSRLAAERPSARLCGLDISPKMLAHAAKKLQGAAGVTLKEGGAGELPYADGEFDAVTCVMSFHHYPYPARAVAEAFRVLKRGGVYILSDVDKRGMGEPGEEEFAFYTADDAARLLADAGFKVEEKFRLTPKSFYVSGRKP